MTDEHHMSSDPDFELEPATEEDETERLTEHMRRMAQRQLRHHMTRGTQLLQQGQAKAAIHYLQRAHKLSPHDVDVALNLGGAYILAGQHRRAAPILERASELAPENPMVWINLGAAYLGNPILATSEQQERAIRAFERALDLNPEAPSVHYNLGLIYRDRNDRDRARHHFEQAARVNPQDADARRILQRMDDEDAERSSRLN